MPLSFPSAGPASLFLAAACFTDILQITFFPGIGISGAESFICKNFHLGAPTSFKNKHALFGQWNNASGVLLPSSSLISNVLLDFLGHSKPQVAVTSKPSKLWFVQCLPVIQNWKPTSNHGLVQIANGIAIKQEVRKEIRVSTKKEG